MALKAGKLKGQIRRTEAAIDYGDDPGGTNEKTTVTVEYESPSLDTHADVKAAAEGGSNTLADVFVRMKVRLLDPEDGQPALDDEGTEVPYDRAFFTAMPTANLSIINTAILEDIDPEKKSRSKSSPTTLKPAPEEGSTA